MPIEGPLRELGLQDVFQLLDLSRKTGVLRVMSRMRDDEGHVYFESGRVIAAAVKSKRAPAIDAAAISEREFERRLKAQIEVAVFDLMSWREGSFSFEERELGDLPGERRVRIATESLMMENARRIDEWSRLSERIPNLRVVPVLAEVVDDHETQLDLLPHEWEVLSLIDGQRDLRTISDLHGRNDFETAKVVYGLVTTGVVEIRPVKRVSVAEAVNVARDDHAAASARTPTTPPRPRVTAPPPDPEIRATLDRGLAAAKSGDIASARSNWERFLVLAPDHPSAAGVRAVLDAATALRTAIDALDSDGA